VCSKIFRALSQISVKARFVWISVNESSTDLGWLRLVGSLNARCLLQNIVSFIGLFCKRDLEF